ncbi:MAG: hypothetical protein AB7H97_20705 [Pseudobdellovibrionaceae bacterium]
MGQFTNLVFGVFLLFGSACATQTQENRPLAAPVVSAKPVQQIPSSPVATSGEPKKELPSSEVKKESEALSEQTWQMRKGKLIGPGKAVSAKVIGKVENKKGGGQTIDYCSDFGEFSIFESKSTNEVGSAEIIIRRKGQDPLCKDDFKGPSINLKIGEGHFAGIAGGILVTEGANVGEGVVESQLFSLEDGREIYRVVHDPNEEYTIKKSGKAVSATFFAKVAVKCELPSEGLECWKRVLEDNKIPKTVKMPNCMAAFKREGKNIGEPAQVTVRARVGNIFKPKLEYINGSATCAPEP